MTFKSLKEIFQKVYKGKESFEGTKIIHLSHGENIMIHDLKNKKEGVIVYFNKNNKITSKRFLLKACNFKRIDR